MGFLSPIFLLGAAAAAVPVLVHLVRQTRARRVQFSSLMFLRRIEQKIVRKRRLRNLLLLAMRCAALLLLAVAFARPYFMSRAAAESSSPGKCKIVLIDGSFSMMYPGVADRARQAARDIVASSAANDRVSLVEFADGSDVLMGLKSDHAEAVSLIDRLKPGYGSTDYLQALQTADSILKDAGPVEREVYLVSDFQASGWNRSAPPVKLGSGTRFIPIDVSDSEPYNLAATDLRAEQVIYSQKYPGKVSAVIGNFGPRPIEDGVIELKLNDLTVERRALRMDAASTKSVEFSDFNVSEGSNQATIEVSGDRFTEDNSRFFTIKRADQSRVLVIETAVRGRSESFFLQQALVSGENTPYAVTTRTAGTANPGEVGDYSVVIVNDVAGVSEGLASALSSFVQNGGGLVLTTGRHTDAAQFNRVFAAISPAHLGDAIQVRSGYALMSQVRTDHPIFGAFARSGRLTSTRVYSHHGATANEGSSVVAALDDGSPIIVEGLAGRGKVVLVATSLDTAWSDLPLTPIFLPLIRQMLEYLGGGERNASYAIGQHFLVPPDRDGSFPAVESPGGGRVEDPRRTTTGELSIRAEAPGFYRLRYRDHIEQVAANIDSKEADLARLDLNELTSSVMPDESNRTSSYEPGRLTAEEVEARQRLWLPLLIAALGLFVAESFLAGRIRIARLPG
jgi:Aerotolerance regulator N-terminal/von Willebrand factor type A domain